MNYSRRYPPPDPTDPFAPLWVLRRSTASINLSQRPATADSPFFNPMTTLGSNIDVQAMRTTRGSSLDISFVSPLASTESLCAAELTHPGYSPDSTFGFQLQTEDEDHWMEILQLERQRKDARRVGGEVGLVGSTSLQLQKPTSSRGGQHRLSPNIFIRTGIIGHGGGTFIQMPPVNPSLTPSSPKPPKSNAKHSKGRSISGIVRHMLEKM